MTEIEIVDKRTKKFWIDRLPEDWRIKDPVTDTIYDLKQKASTILETHDLTGIVFNEDDSMDLMFKKKGENVIDRWLDRSSKRRSSS